MSNRIDIIITESPAISATLSPLDRGNLTEEAIDFSWVIGAQGGFKSASVEMVTTRNRAYEILNDYISKRIVFSSPLSPHPSQQLWEGMVYEVSIDDGKNVVTRSMANVYNRISILYSATDYTQAAPQGAQQSVVTVNDAASLAAYGWREMVYTVGEMNSTDATRLANAMLTRYKKPMTARGDSAIGGAVDVGRAKITIGCVGWGEYLDKLIYKQIPIASLALNTLISNLIGNIQFLGPVALFPTDYTNIVANAYTRSGYQNKNITALSYIYDLCAYGHSASAVTEQALFGIAENRLIYYAPFPSAVSYYTSIYDTSERILDAATGLEVAPWNVRPGKIIACGDLLPDGPAYASDVLGVESFVIGEVRFEAPNRVTLTPWTGDPTQTLLRRMVNA